MLFKKAKDSWLNHAMEDHIGFRRISRLNMIIDHKKFLKNGIWGRKHSSVFKFQTVVTTCICEYKMPKPT